MTTIARPTRKAEEILEAHRHRKLRAFLASRQRTNEEEEALWHLVGEYRPAMSMQLAVRVVAELERSERTVGELLDGWIPEALKGDEK